MNTLTVALALSGLAYTEPGPSDLDFWVGDWDCTLYSRSLVEPEKWEEAPARNLITKEMKGNVIRETFTMEGYEGTSLNTFDRLHKVWRQTWVDQNGAFRTFSSKVEKGKFVFVSTLDSKRPETHMIFESVSSDKLTWVVDQKRKDKWVRVLRMEYRRRKSSSSRG